MPPAKTFGGRDLFGHPVPEAVFGVVGGGNAGAPASVAADAVSWGSGRSWPRRGCIRTARFRLDLNLREDGTLIEPHEEDPILADWRADPAERTNLVAAPGFAEVIAALRRELPARREGAVEAAVVSDAPDQTPEFAPPVIDRR